MKKRVLIIVMALGIAFSTISGIAVKSCAQGARESTRLETAAETEVTYGQENADAEVEVTSVPDASDRPERMAHNIYMDPDLSEGSGEYRAFQIDFMGCETPVHTYWALCNWGMKDGFGAYGGLQNTVDGTTAIMSFWEGEKDGTILRASRMYPKGDESYFGGEGEGTHWITGYPWICGQWYRMLFFCWDDAQTGHTFVGQWVKDLTSGKWTLISYYDTNLVNSAMTGGFSQFQENYCPGRDYLPRSFQVKNIYIYDRIKQDWLSLNKTKISYDPPEWKFLTAGTHEFGAGEDFFWGRTGEYVSDQTAYDAATPRNIRVSITQPDEPEMQPSALTSLTAVPGAGWTDIRWDVSEFGAPVIRFDISLEDSAGNILAGCRFTRPEVQNLSVAVPYSAVGKVVMQTTDVYGGVQAYEVSVDH